MENNSTVLVYISNFIIASPIHNGDWVNINEEIGKAVDINWRSVKIHNRFNEERIIPNNTLAKSKIKNLSRPHKIYAEILQFGFSYDDTPEKVKKVLLEIADKNDKVLDILPPIVYMLSYDDFYISYGLKFFVKDFEDTLLIKDELLSRVYHAANENGLIMPYPKQDIELNMKFSK